MQCARKDNDLPKNKRGGTIGNRKNIYQGGIPRIRVRNKKALLYIGPGQLAKSNVEQVERIRGIVESLGRTIATPEEARQRLGLKGANNVNF